MVYTSHSASFTTRNPGEHVQSLRLGAEATAAVNALNAQPAIQQQAAAATASLVAQTGQQAQFTNNQLSQQSAAAGK